MASPKHRSKRASMREGPLSQLFRRTDEDSAHEGPAHERLRHAFSSEIPDDILAGAGGTAQAEPGVAQAGKVADAANGAEAAAGARESVRGGADGHPQALREDGAGAGPYGAAGEAPAAERTEIGEEPGPAPLRDGRPSGSGQPVLRVVGVGGAGVNAVNRMVEAEVEGVEFIAINTDLQSLQQCTADVTLHIGERTTGGLGSGADAALGRQAASEEYDRIKALLKGSDMIFVTAGAGGGTGTGGAPVVARIAREVGALTVAIVTKPFGFEGSRRIAQAEEGIRDLAQQVDTLITVPNDRLLSVLDRQTTMVEAFRVADDVLRQGVQGISDLVTLPGLINLDFADVRTIMSGAGNALLGIGMGAGETRAIDAAQQAISSPLLEISMDGARSILLSITGGPDLSLWEVNDAARAISEAAHPDANIIFGAMVDEKLDEHVWVTVVATGYADRSSRSRPAGLSEPAGEPRVARIASSPRATDGAARGGENLAVGELQVPEFVPR
jgi:cell division protein FtsZ